MSPNGLRRWRRYAKKCRYRSRKEGTRATGATAHGATARALFWTARNHPNFALPPNPFTARSLVGMTMGARKRAHRAAMVGLDYEDGVRFTLTTSTKYHIGERLRPCPGCPECEHGKCWCCDNCGTTKGLCDLTLAEVRCKCGKGCGQWWISYPATTICDGSGVLPAKHQLCWL